MALVLALRRTGVTRYLALWSSDFPQPDRLPDRAAAIQPPSLTGEVYPGGPRSPQGPKWMLPIRASAAAFHAAPSP